MPPMYFDHATRHRIEILSRLGEAVDVAEYTGAPVQCRGTDGYWAVPPVRSRCTRPAAVVRDGVELCSRCSTLSTLEFVPAGVSA